MRGRDYVLAAKIAGERPWRVITVEILPNLLPVMGSQFVFSVIMAILSESSLSFIGLGSTQSFAGTMAPLRAERFCSEHGRMVVVPATGTDDRYHRRRRIVLH
ncbi:MAG: ABC transporter permease subunit [Bifidobacterium adolescentis]